MYIETKTMKEIIGKLKIFKISNEELHKLIDFENALQLLKEDDIEVSECILTPYYVDDGKRYEFYSYELNIREVEQKDFDKYLLQFTGKQKIEDIPSNIVERQKNCYIEFLNGENYFKKQLIQNYIEYIYNSSDIQQEVKSCFPKFTKDNLYFEIY
jgi:hypothetical protein